MPPDWFVSRAPAWRDWAIVHLLTTREVERKQMDEAKAKNGR